ncbi:MAG: hypothetical protein J3K34DRAFT_456927 [Monoraphidium minutum]|nr:MAG: hypothetical protein J3K34DRAFT_456927 [Monoraphidium minutum]
MEAECKGSRGPKPRIPLVVNRKRPGKGPEPSEMIAALESLKISTQAQLQSLTLEYENLRATDDALGAVVLCLEGLIAATRLLPGSGAGGAGAADAEEGYIDLDGGAAAAAERYRTMDAAAVAQRVQQYVHWSSVDLFRLTAGADDAAAAGRLEEQLGRLMAMSAALLATKPQILAEVGCYRLDTLKPYAADPPPPTHWDFVIRQAKMSRRQELAAARLMELYSGRLAVLLPRRAALLARQAEQPGDADAQADVLADLECCELEYVYNALAFPNALYSRILRPPQAASIWVSSFPFVPQMLVLDRALQDMTATRERDNAARHAADAAAEGSPTRGRRRPAAAGGAGGGEGDDAEDAARQGAAGPPLAGFAVKVER